MDLQKSSKKLFSMSLRLLHRSFNRNGKVEPVTNVIAEDSNPQKRVNNETIAKLERLSLVDFGNIQGIQRLERAINFAERLRKFPVKETIEPLYSVLEDKKLRLRDDRVTDGNYCKKILKNSQKVEDEYFVAPPGNIPKKQ